MCRRVWAFPDWESRASAWTPALFIACCLLAVLYQPARCQLLAFLLFSFLQSIMADKEATVYIADVGASMGKRRNGREVTDLEWAMQYIWDRITTTVSTLNVL
jgi:hypothetical protein